MLGDKIKDALDVLYYMQDNYVTEAKEDLEQLLEAAKERDELKARVEEFEVKKKSFANIVFSSVEHKENDENCECNECSYIRMEKQIAEDEKYIELGKALELAFEHEFSVITFDDYQEVKTFIGNKEQLIMWYRSEVKDES